MPPARLPQLIEAHKTANRDTAARWSAFAAHRARVTDLVLGAGPPQARRALVLGAGNCNDLDLALVTRRFQQVHLADLDADAVTAAHARQDAVIRERLFLHAPVDASGALDLLRGWQRRPPRSSDLLGLAEVCAERVVKALPGSFEVVLSSCVLSQIVWTCGALLGDEHPFFVPIAQALAVGHLRALLRLCSPGGTVVLVTDAVGSDTYPVEALCAAQGARAVLEEADETGVLFAGTSPRFIARALREDPALSSHNAGVHWASPWLWTFSPDIIYLTYAVAIERGS